MWTAVLVLAIAVNFEPTRIGLIVLMLSRLRPLLQLGAFLSGGIVVSTCFGLIFLFVAQQSLLAEGNFSPAKAQIGIGVVALVAAAVLASNISFKRSPRPAPTETDSDTSDLENAPPGLTGRLGRRARTLLEGESPWFALGVGFILALPSVEYLALLALIAGSEAPALTQTAALLTYVLVANAVAAIPLVSYLVAPDRTRAVLARFYDWIRARRRQDWALLLAVAGVLMLVMGIRSL
jgi:hypothetical protein